MTRENYLKKVSTSTNQTIRENVNRYINWIFDDFENRTCENCTYLIGKDKESSCVFGYLPVNMYESDFGCNKWEKKDD